MCGDSDPCWTTGLRSENLKKNYYILKKKKKLAEVEDQKCEALTRIKQAWVDQRTTFICKAGSAPHLPTIPAPPPPPILFYFLFPHLFLNFIALVFTA